VNSPVVEEPEITPLIVIKSPTITVVE
jgi:hypothetical protein